jgi:bifunctional lysine-specific demethylase and histidyl-hydroxylase NO66
LTRCVGDVDRFLADTWSKAPMYRPGADPEGFTDLLSSEDVDHLISTAFLRTPAFRLVKDGKQLPERSYTKAAGLGGRTVSGVADPGRIFELFRDGATIVLQGVHRYWLPLGRFVRDLERALTVPAQVNAYITPPRSQGFALHYDTHDVFVLQVSGHKRWQVQAPVIDAPLPDQSGITGPESAPLLSAELGPGDCLYLPRGFRHSAEAQTAASVHLTVGLLTTTWHDVLQEVLMRSRDEPTFREGLPVGYADDPTALAALIEERLALFAAWVGELDVAGVASTMTRRFWGSRPPLLSGQLRQLSRLDTVSDESTVSLRSGVTCWLQVGTGELRAVMGDRDLVMPAALEPAMRFVLERGRFVVRDLSELDGPSRLTFVRRLIREGLLEASLDDP